MTAQTETSLRAPVEFAPRRDRGEEDSARAEPPPAREAAAAEEALLRPPPAARRGRRLVSKLTLRVLAINVLALMLLVGGLLYLGRYEERLIQAEMEGLRTEALIFAGAIAEGAVVGDPDVEQELDHEQAGRMVRRLSDTTDARTRLFEANGALIADSRVLQGPSGVVEVEPLLPLEQNAWLRQAFNAVYGWVTQMLPDRKMWPAYEEHAPQLAFDYPPAVRALEGGIGQQVWTDPEGGRVLGVAVPVQRLRAVMGAILVTSGTEKIERAMQTVREDILKVFLVALGITVLLSLYLAGTITRPIRRLARAAEAVRTRHGRELALPDFSRRRDEIGDLSEALSDMTGALWARMDAIERFAADVSHEIKNPLTSLRSAVETVARVKDPEQQRRLMSILLEDVQRLDRLITDISDASRLDAELSRAQSSTVDVRRMLGMLAELYRSTVGEDGPRIDLDIRTPEPLLVQGLESRVVQVFRNLIANAVSFSPKGGRITIAAGRIDGMVEVTVEDEGPGIPAGKLDAIFDRFYSERPAGEKFGTHSGLGLSISKQIVDAHHGIIFARNREGRSGARFTVRLPAS